ncbi:MAG: hypothetical protein A2017_17220 [Lentisphaerae bacterium GWF2_44_16]|nr:MAG: hypothetical protein A2017_17220 [Lentisphaerae bacterium GWF2_44_16]
MSEEKITELVEPTKEVLEWIVEKLGDYSGWTVKKYSGTSRAKIYQEAGVMSLPAALVSYKGSAANENYPRRNLNFSVIIMTEDAGDIEDAADDAQPLLDTAMDMLDQEEYEGIIFKFKGDNALDISQNIAAYELSFSAEDY